MTDLLIGMQIDEYRLESLLGQGGMARVYRGLDTGLKRYAAIKVIDTPYRQDEAYIVRFEREARAIAQLDHPHVVTVYRYGRVANLLYLAMKYIEGADLHAILEGYEQDGEFIHFADVIRLTREIGAALDYAHSQGIIHRDVKPSNVMLDADGRVYLTDFGLALLADVGTRGEILGSPSYIAPEQAVSSAGAVPQSDLYALGVMLYRMVTGRLPFVHDDVLELMMLHLTAEPPAPHTIRPEISPALEAVILKALAKEPNDRYPDGRALADAVEAALENKAVNLIATAPTLTIMDRVALDMEMLPRPIAVTPQATATQPAAPSSQATILDSASMMGDQMSPISADRSSTAHGLSLPLRAIGGAGVLLLIVLVIIFLFRNREDTGKPVADVNGTIEMTLTPVETAEVLDVLLPGGMPTIAVMETADLPPDSTLALLEPTTVGNEITNISPKPRATPPQETLPLSSARVYLPVIAGEEGQSTPAATTPPTGIPRSTETLFLADAITPPASTPSPTAYRLLIATNEGDSLFVVNRSGVAFPLTPLRLGSGNSAIQGAEWGVGQLEPGNCVTAWKDGRNPRPPNLYCDRVGARVIRRGPDRLWKSQFDLFYDGEQIGVCNPQEQCLVEIQSN